VAPTLQISSTIRHNTGKIDTIAAIAHLEKQRPPKRMMMGLIQ
jgi:hypothetical protein